MGNNKRFHNWEREIVYIKRTYIPWKTYFEIQYVEKIYGNVCKIIIKFLNGSLSKWTCSSIWYLNSYQSPKRVKRHQINGNIILAIKWCLARNIVVRNWLLRPMETSSIQSNQSLWRCNCLLLTSLQESYCYKWQALWC